MNYLESLAYLESLSPTLEKPTVERIRRFLSEQGEPQEAFATFHVAGTNGKGSTVAVLDSVLRATGFKVGRFTGPHLLRWNERFHVDGAPISDDRFAEYATKLRELSEKFAGENSESGKLTWFEFITALAFFYFRDEKIDVAVIEVGLGGRFDATNVLGQNLLCSIITNISLDHTQILGATEELIAFEKAGIILPGKPVVTATRGTALQIIKERASQIQAPLFILNADDKIELWENDFLVDSCDSDRLLDRMSGAMRLAAGVQSTSSLVGEHQRTNALLAFLAIYLANVERDENLSFNPIMGKIKGELKLPERKADRDSVLLKGWKEGINNVYWPGRMQHLSERVILDGAHNPGGARALRSALDTHYAGRRILFVLSCFDNKDAGGIVQTLLKPGDHVFLCEASTKRATFSKDKLLQLARDVEASPEVLDTVALAYNAALARASEQDLIVCTGSFATVRECMQEVGWQSVEDGRRKSGKIDSAEIFHGHNKRG